METENAGRKRDSKTLYRIVKELSEGTKLQIHSLRKTYGRMIKIQEEAIKRWREHFEGVLNCDDPEACCGHLVGHGIEELEIDTDDLRKEEIKTSEMETTK